MCKNEFFQSLGMKNEFFKLQGRKTKLMYNLGTKTIVYLLFYSSKVIPFNSVSWNVSYLFVVNFEKWMEGQN